MTGRADIQDRDSPDLPVQTYAIVSGKGGSGKTMVAVAIAQGLASTGAKVLIVDADLGTGGLTYYLTFDTFSHARVGISDALLKGVDKARLIGEAARSTRKSEEIIGLENIRLIPVGDQRRIQDVPAEIFGGAARSIIENARSFDVIVFDCRGGIDAQSLAVCALCEHIILIVETDATSIKASQHLTDVLAECGLKSKVSGFILNKAMDDPTSIARSANTFFGTNYLGAIPFDIDATRCYIQGKIPSQSSLFSRHVRSILSRSPFFVAEYLGVRTLTPEEFGTVSLRSPEARFGSLLIGTIAIYAAIGFSLLIASPSYPLDQFLSPITAVYIYVALSVLLVILGLSERVKEALGRAFRVYNRIITYPFRKLF